MKRARVLLASLLLVTLVMACDTQHIASSNGGMSVHFCHLTDCNDVFKDLFAGAESLSCAFYELGDKEMRRILIERDALVVIDEGESLHGARVREGEGIMHNKFCIINKSVLITGSHNPTDGARHDYNNLIVIASRPLARNYDRWLQTRKEHGIKVMHDGSLIESCFSPIDDCKGRLLQAIGEAKQSVSFALFTFTDEDVASAIIDRHDSGLAVTGIVESWQAKGRNQYYRLQEAGVPVFLEVSERLQHNKVFVIDDEMVITGSYNPTLAAATINDENLLFVHHQGVAERYGSLIGDIINRTQTFK